MAKNDPTVHIRVPAPLLKRIRVAAAESDRSMNAEVVDRLEKSFAMTDEERGELKRFLAGAMAVLDRKVDRN